MNSKLHCVFFVPITVDAKKHYIGTLPHCLELRVCLINMKKTLLTKYMNYKNGWYLGVAGRFPTNSILFIFLKEEKMPCASIALAIVQDRLEKSILFSPDIIDSPNPH